jgi:DnaJ-class molecular chaperone
MYDRAYLHFEVLAKSAPNATAKEHCLAMAKSIRAVAPCKLCGGTHKVRCSTCHGRKKVDLQCTRCGGSGKGQTIKGVIQCPGCKGVGIFKGQDCPRCKAQGIVDCKVKGCRATDPPKAEAIFEAEACAFCSGAGVLFRRAALPCPECNGVGLWVAPKADVGKRLK